MEEKGTLAQIDLTKELKVADEVEVILGDYEFVLKDGKTYFVKKKPKYPKTYEDCRAIINAPEEKIRFGYKSRLLSKFQQLLICRDAYLEIACWKPSDLQIVYGISRSSGKIEKIDDLFGGVMVLEFPTEEMRDAFKENFKDLIEECKELL